MSKLKTYRVGYWLEQGFSITVRARSSQLAAKLIRQRLDEEMDRLEDSERVHHDDGIACIDEVQP